MTKMMKCGHSANAVRKNKDGTETPCCAICVGLRGDEAYTVVDAPDLTGRMMNCSYHAEPKIPSAMGSAFFEHRPDKPTDIYYCGCFGWD